MKIALDVSSTSRYKIQTGVQRMVRGLYNHLEKSAKVKTVVWSSSFSSYCSLPRAQLLRLIEPFSQKKFSHAQPEKLWNKYPWSKTIRWLHQRWNQWSVGSKLKEGDLLFVPEIFQDSRVEYFQRFLPLSKVKSLAIFHDGLAWSLKDYKAADESSRFTDYMATLSKFDLVLCISKESQKDLLFFWKINNLSAAQTHVLYWPMPMMGLRSINDPTFENKKILFVATLEDRKNHLRILDACEILWNEGIDFTLELVGRSIPHKSDGILSKIKYLQRNNRKLVWHQHIDDESLIEAYKKCSFTVYPSIREGFGLPILESVWYSRPCVCGSNGALGEVGEGGGCYFVDQTDIINLKIALGNLLTKAEIYRIYYKQAIDRNFRYWKDYMLELNTILKNFLNLDTDSYKDVQIQ